MVSSPSLAPAGSAAATPDAPAVVRAVLFGHDAHSQEVDASRLGEFLPVGDNRLLWIDVVGMPVPARCCNCSVSTKP